jgi:hypothetical protein
MVCIGLLIDIPYACNYPYFSPSLLLPTYNTCLSDIVKFNLCPLRVGIIFFEVSISCLCFIIAF